MKVLSRHKNWPEHSLRISAYSKNALTWNPAIATIYCSLTFHILRHLNSIFKANCIVLGGFNLPRRILTRSCRYSNPEYLDKKYLCYLCVISSPFSKDCPHGVRGSTWIFWVPFIFSPKQRLRPLGYCVLLHLQCFMQHAETNLKNGIERVFVKTYSKQDH